MTPELKSKIRTLVGAPKTKETWVDIDVESHEAYSCCSGNVETTYTLSAGLSGKDLKAAQKAGEPSHWTRTFTSLEVMLEEMLRDD